MFNQKTCVPVFLATAQLVAYPQGKGSAPVVFTGNGMLLRNNEKENVDATNGTEGRQEHYATEDTLCDFISVKFLKLICGQNSACRSLLGKWEWRLTWKRQEELSG